MNELTGQTIRGTPLTAIEAVAAVAGLVCVLLTIRQNIWCWPVGLLMVVLYIYIFWKARLYSDMGLQIIYVFLQFYGWHQWLHGGRDHGELKVQRIQAVAGLGWVLVGCAGAVGLGFVMHRYSDASLPYWDAATTVLSLIAQYLMAKKLLENWLFWITVDVMAVGIYAVKSLYLTSGLYAVFLGLAITGYFTWRASLRQTTPVAAPA